MSRIPRSGPRVNRGKPNPHACFNHQKKEPPLCTELIKLARKSGQLNLSGRGMIEVPDMVWNINNPTEDERKAMTVSLDQGDGDHWWDQSDFTKLYLSSNQISSIPDEIGNLRSLTVLELQDNMLVTLPNGIGELLQLSKLNISHNKIEKLPDAFFQLKELRLILGQHNLLEELSDDIGNLSMLEQVDLSHNKLTSLPATIGFLSRLTRLNLSHNSLAAVPPDIGSMNALQILDLSWNRLKSLPEQLGTLCHMEQLFLQQNELRALPSFSGCPKLKELHAGNNQITELPIDVLETLLSLKTLDLKNNKIKVLLPDITMIQGLERLDLTNNDLATLPYTLGTMTHIHCLGVEGNPLRAIRKDILKRGTVHLLKWLQERLSENPENAKRRTPSGSDGSDLVESIERFSLKATHALDLSKQSLKDVPEEIFKLAAECDVKQIELSKNNFTSLPKGLELMCPTMSELSVGFNRISEVPAYLGCAKHLTFLDLRNNLLAGLPKELRMLSCIREVNLSFNRLSKLPDVIRSWATLEILFLSDNHIDEVDMEILPQLKQLAVLDLRNNNISQVPPELGNMRQLRNLQLEGNPFRNPRPAILSKGTSALLEFLRDRIPR
ncbi:leucine-rich repeat-containing protein 40-like [Ornithodoros turicata]|uniref:leucine-rich repeat-containing protein 40-like n=1 Tax=Ornithodoros turicata TaxID=34597 RepID=UPI0031388A71